MHPATPAARRPLVEWRGLRAKFANADAHVVSEERKKAHTQPVCECWASRHAADRSMDFDAPALAEMAFSMDFDEAPLPAFALAIDMDDCLAASFGGKCTCKQVPASPKPPKQPMERKTPWSPSDVTAASFDGLEGMSRSQREALLSMAGTRGKSAANNR